MTKIQSSPSDLAGTVVIGGIYKIFTYANDTLCTDIYLCVFKYAPLKLKWFLEIPSIGRVYSARIRMAIADRMQFSTLD